MSRKRTIDIPVGQRFGRLAVVHADIYVQSGTKKVRAARLRCDCGNTTEVVLGSLLSGATRSCGCLEQESRRAPKPANRKVFVREGQRFGRLTVTEAESARVGSLKECNAERRNRNDRRAKVICDCGAEREVPLYDLIRGFTTSCGCYQREVSRETIKSAQAAVVTHGLSSHPLFRVWQNMLARCENPNSTSYPAYGGRGIKVHGPWHDVAVFISDVEKEIGPRPPGRHPSGQPLYTLDRTDPDGDYGPGKVQWATAQEQAANRRRDVLITQLRARVAELEAQLEGG